MKDSTYIGIYLGFCNVVESCQRYGLAGLEKGLRTWEQQAPVKEPVKKLELSELIKITDLASTVIVRRLDFKINANNIFKLAGHARNKGYCLRKKVDSQAFSCVKNKDYINWSSDSRACNELREGGYWKQSPVMSDPGVRPDGCQSTQSRRVMRATSLGESGTETNPRHHQWGPLLMGQCKRKTFMKWIQAQT